MRPLLLLAMLSVFSACPSREQPIPDASIDVIDAGPGAPRKLEVKWAACPLHTGETGTDAECALLHPPLARTAPEGQTANYFVKRYRPPGGRGLRALWMLQGGPGASGLVFENLSEAFGTRFPDVDYYFPDHRGTGRSMRVSCPEQETPTSEGGNSITDTEWPACLAAVQSTTNLVDFNVTNAANDVGLAIDAIHDGGQPVFIVGISYGTYLAHRYLQLFPNQVSGVVFDSIAPPGSSLYRQDQDSGEAARDFFAACAADTFCRSKLGPDPVAKAESLFARLKNGHCSAIAVPGIPTHVAFRRAFGGFLMDPTLRLFIAPVVYRADRCEPRDIAALQIFMSQITGEQTNVPLEHLLWGWVVSQNILHSEMGETPLPSPMQLEAWREDAMAARDVTLGFEATLDWPRYPADEFTGKLADTTTPVLMLQGGLDPATLMRKAFPFRDHFVRANQTWVPVNSATHTVLVSSPYVSDAGERRSCGTRVMMNFLENPTVPLDTSCVPLVEPVPFNRPSVDYSRAFFGTTDAWE